LIRLLSKSGTYYLTTYRPGVVSNLHFAVTKRTYYVSTKTNSSKNRYWYISQTASAMDGSECRECHQHHAVGSEDQESHDRAILVPGRTGQALDVDVCRRRDRRSQLVVVRQHTD
jgi:hypothetical protein